MHLPTPVQAYFEQDSAPDGAAPLHAFAPDAVVRDEGKLHVGHDAIDAWWRAAKVKVRSYAEPREVCEQVEGVTVRAVVNGEFPGSPVVLTFDFRLNDAKISALEIKA
jgi:hypothetical protein